ncbi:hypothetical protein XPA_005117 [Xanthoria parietina]
MLHFDTRTIEGWTMEKSRSRQVPVAEILAVVFWSSCVNVLLKVLQSALYFEEQLSTQAVNVEVDLCCWHADSQTNLASSTVSEWPNLPFSSRWHLLAAWHTTHAKYRLPHTQAWTATSRR